MLDQVMYYIDIFAQLVLAVSILATIVVRLTPSRVDDERTSRVVRFVVIALSYLPTFGINPRTRELEKALEVVKNDQSKKD